MSKANNPLSVATGKLGNVVYFKLKYSKDGQRQGAREYVANPANPRTDAQLSQRVKMTAITNCYRAFGNVIRRAFEGTEYGQPSYARWSSLAMGNQFAGPWLIKGDRRPCIVLGVPVSIGSLPGVTVTGGDKELLATSLRIGSSGFDSISELSSLLLASQQWLTVGDQVTICVLSRSTAVAPLYFGSSYSFYIDPNNSSPLPLIAGCSLVSEYNALGIGSNYNLPLAAAVIISREGSHLRSTSYWGYNNAFKDAYNIKSDAEALPSYRSSSATQKTDWPVDPDATPTPSEFNTQTQDGTSVTLRDLRVDSGYLVATAYRMGYDTSLGEVWFKCDDTASTHYNKWLTGFNSDTDTTPEGVSGSETILYRVGSSATPNQVLLLNWLVANGVNERWLYVGT